LTYSELKNYRILNKFTRGTYFLLDILYVTTIQVMSITKIINNPLAKSLPFSFPMLGCTISNRELVFPKKCFKKWKSDLMKIKVGD